MDTINLWATIFIIASLAGLLPAFLYGKKATRFHWLGYFLLFIWPLLVILSFAIFVDHRILFLFLISCVVGFFCEYLVGFIYHETLKENLWLYNRLNFYKYTSYLIIPFWGIAACLFWFISKTIGL